jgi:hypothetical protein
LGEGRWLNMLLISRNYSDDIAFEHMTPNTPPKRFDESLQRDVFFHHNRNARGSADDEIYRFVKDSATPADSPISQVGPLPQRKLSPFFGFS